MVLLPYLSLLVLQKVLKCCRQEARCLKYPNFFNSGDEDGRGMNEKINFISWQGHESRRLLAVYHTAEIDIPVFDEIVYIPAFHAKEYRCCWMCENRMRGFFGMLAAHLVLVVLISALRFATLCFLFMPVEMFDVD